MTQLPTITRTALDNGKHRYEVDGEVHTAESVKLYTHASVYRFETLSDYDLSLGREVGHLAVFLHTREDLAAKGNSDAKRICQTGHWSRVPGIVTITEG